MTGADGSMSKLCTSKLDGSWKSLGFRVWGRWPIEFLMGGLREF